MKARNWIGGVIACALSLAGCAQNPVGEVLQGGFSNPSQSSVTDLGDDDKTYGDDFEDLGIYDGDFQEGTQNVTVECLSGTPDCYTIEKSVITFTKVSADSVYSIQGEWDGSIVIDIGDEYKFDLELHGFSIKSAAVNPVTILSGSEVAIKAKKDTKNYIYDNREGVDETDETLYSGAVHATVDLEIGGKGELSVTSKNNNGIHTKDDLQVQNLTLTVACRDNALKGNDSVEIKSGALTLIATGGDGIKTTNSTVSEKGNQRGVVSISNATVTVYAACDGIDAAYDARIDGENTLLNIYTDKYSNYSEEVTATSTAEYYIRFSSKSYQYSVKYYGENGEYEWVNASYHSSVGGGMGKTYYYYVFPKKTEYEKMQVFVYSSNMEQGQEEEYTAASDSLTLNGGYDTLALTSRNGNLSYSWTNYTTSSSHGGFAGGPGGGMNDGNTDKGEYSTKGIKSFNEIIVNNGNINIKSYDDAVHANNDVELESGQTPLGNVTINGGTLSLYSNDDGMHADGNLTVGGGNISILNSYEGVEGQTISVTGGEISVIAKDDGFNSTATSGTGILLSGGLVYVYCTGDGFDCNSRTSYSGISFEGGDAVIISNSSMNSAIDTEQGYQYSAGSIIAIMPRGGMTSEATHCANFNSIGTSQTISLTSGEKVTVSGDFKYSFAMPCTISNAYVVILNRNISLSV